MTKQQEENICPNCNSDNLNYMDFDVDGEVLVRAVECEDCGCQFRENYNLVFDSQDICYRGEQRVRTVQDLINLLELIPGDVRATMPVYVFSEEHGKAFPIELVDLDIADRVDININPQKVGE